MVVLVQRYKRIPQETTAAPSSCDAVGRSPSPAEASGWPRRTPAHQGTRGQERAWHRILLPEFREESRCPKSGLQYSYGVDLLFGSAKGSGLLIIQILHDITYTMFP